MTKPNPSDETIEKLIHWGAKQESIRTLLLTSTRAVPGAPVDALSDYDVILVVHDIHPFVADHSWLDDFGEVLVSYWDPIHPDIQFGIHLCANVVQYSSGLKIDFILWPVELLQKFATALILPAELDAGYQVLLDKDNLSGRLQPPTGKAYIPSRPSAQAYRSLVNDFLSDAPYVAKYLWRDQLLPARWCLECDMRHLYLRQLLEWRVELDHDWSLPVGNLGKGLEKHLSAELWSAFEATFVGASLADNWQALFELMGLFRQVAIEVGEHLGFKYPDLLHHKVEAYVKHVQQMNPVISSK
jgi:aminoglycoside 6-adenylyltransferase